MVQVGASYLCAKGSLGENEPVGNRTDMFAAECVRSTIQLLAAKDKAAAATFRLTLDLAKSALSHRIGKQAEIPRACFFDEGVSAPSTKTLTRDVLETQRRKRCAESTAVLSGNIIQGCTCHLTFPCGSCIHPPWPT